MNLTNYTFVLKSHASAGKRVLYAQNKKPLLLIWFKMLVVKHPQRRKKQKRTKTVETNSSIITNSNTNVTYNQILSDTEIKYQYNQMETQQFINNTNMTEYSHDGSEGMQSVDLEETISYKMSSTNDAQSQLNWNDLIKNGKNILHNDDRISIEIDVSTGINAKCIQFINSFFKSIGTRNHGEIFSLNPQQMEINQGLNELLMANKNNSKYKLIQHIIECYVDNGTIKIRLDLDYDKYLKSSDSQYHRFKNGLLDELGEILGIDIDLIVYKQIQQGSIWVFFRVIGDYLSLAFSNLSKPFHGQFVINGESENDENKFQIDDLVLIEYRNHEYEGKVIGLKKYKNKYNEQKCDVTVQYISGKFIFSNTETVDSKSNRLRLKQPGGIIDNGYIDGEIEGSGSKLSITLKWFKPNQGQSYNM